MDDLFVIIGLGNPGRKYNDTKHNIGFYVVEFLAMRHNIKMSKIKFKALYGEGVIGGKKVLLVKPQTYMNRSGESVRDLINWYKVPVENIIIIYDDIDLPVGKLRLRPKGSAGTHNGMRSVIYQIMSDEFPRVRVGIDKPPEGWKLANYVLSKFSGDEIEKIKEAIVNASDAVEAIMGSGIDQAMNKFNNQ
ncbi:aminoacyl-tRNA hydrolase [Herbivorax sp. ANBcel31]|uniref:aminoacyl-tRNA hydrolase n=1 Tax=Herbivorax sp. ANBcel31 TaxID=3069754 RepID=UPI0027B65973|nr:aminoacyl-tRNA hydrolase [Herbivorax sp. ANBcel31]MDQ2086521.1 aminoacyl-tRNA hydrolase [Herbivorax sp. ANBcel31]